MRIECTSHLLCHESSRPCIGGRAAHENGAGTRHPLEYHLRRSAAHNYDAGHIDISLLTFQKIGNTFHSQSNCQHIDASFPSVQRRIPFLEDIVDSSWDPCLSTRKVPPNSSRPNSSQMRTQSNSLDSSRWSAWDESKQSSLRSQNLD